MLPKLYEEVESVSRKRLIGTLDCCFECDVTEVTNGLYTLVLETTVNDNCANNILSQRMIGIKPNPFDDMQYFEIKKTERTIDGIIKAEAKHIKSLCFAICTNASGAEMDNPITFTGTPEQAWAELVNHYIVAPVPFSFSSDITTSKTLMSGLSVSNSLGNILGGQEGSFLDVWGGEYHWDNFAISLKQSRGRNTGYKLRYGQNISNAAQIESSENTYSHILPFAWYSTSSGAKVSLSVEPIEIPNNQAIYNKTFVLDCSEVLEPYIVGPASVGTHQITTVQAKEMITRYAVEYASINGLGNLSVSIDVTLRSELDGMKSIGLCDTVKVILDNFGTEATAKVTKVTYDALMERWKSVTVGSQRITMADLLLNKRRYFNDNK